MTERRLPIVPMSAYQMGRIRLGALDGKRPTRLDHFRLTSPARAPLERIVAEYGGEVRTWDGPSGREFEAHLGTDTIDVVIPLEGMDFSQFYEMWTGGGCQRRCDGAREQLSDQDCLCPEDTALRLELAQKGQACHLITRLSVIIPASGHAALWRLDTRGYYAATEIPGALSIARWFNRGGMVSARLRIEKRTVKRAGQTHRFIVPVLELPAMSGAELTEQLTMGAAAQDRALPAPSAPSDAPPPAEAAPGPASGGGHPPGGAASPQGAQASEAPVLPPGPGPATTVHKRLSKSASTRAQHGKIAVLCDEARVSKDEAHARMGVESCKDLTKAGASELIDWLQDRVAWRVGHRERLYFLAKDLGYSDDEFFARAGTSDLIAMEDERATDLIMELEQEQRDKTEAGGGGGEGEGTPPSPGPDQAADAGAAPSSSSDPAPPPQTWNEARQQLDAALSWKFNGQVARARWLSTKLTDRGVGRLEDLSADEVAAIAAEVEATA